MSNAEISQLISVLEKRLEEEKEKMKVLSKEYGKPVVSQVSLSVEKRIKQLKEIIK